MPGGRPKGSKNKVKPFKDALRMALAEGEPDSKALRRIAMALIDKALAGDIAAVKEVADRMDGKVPQAITNDDDGEPFRMTFEWKRSES